MKFKKIKLPFKYEALEPFIDHKTVDCHYNKHHNGYETKFNAGAEGTELEKFNSIQEVMENYDSISDEYKTLVRNAGGGLINHNFYWTQFVINRELNPEEIENNNLIKKQFGSIEKFKEEVEAKGMGIFGSGWVWAIKEDEKIKIITTINQENPWMSKISNVILGIDIWEHAYYLKYQSNRKEYINNIWNLLPFKE